MSEHPMERYLAEQAAKPGHTMTITKAAYVFLLEQLRAMEHERSAGAATLDVIDYIRRETGLDSGWKTHSWEDINPFDLDAILSEAARLLDAAPSPSAEPRGILTGHRLLPDAPASPTDGEPEATDE